MNSNPITGVEIATHRYTTLVVELAGLGDGWDGEDAPEPTKETVSAAAAILALVGERIDVAPTSAIPIKEGGVSIEYEGDVYEVFLEVYNDRTVGVMSRNSKHRRAWLKSTNDTEEVASIIVRAIRDAQMGQLPIPRQE